MVHGSAESSPNPRFSCPKIFLPGSSGLVTVIFLLHLFNLSTVLQNKNHYITSCSNHFPGWRSSPVRLFFMATTGSGESVEYNANY